MRGEHRRRRMRLLRNCRGRRSCAPLHAGRLEAAGPHPPQASRSGSSARRRGSRAPGAPAICGLKRSARRGGGGIERSPPLRRRPGGGNLATYEQQKEQVIRGLPPPNTTFSAVVFDVFGSPGPSAAAWLKKTAGPALRRDFDSDGVAAAVVRDGDRPDGRGSGSDEPAIAGARTRLVA